MLKYIHLVSALISISLFVARGIWTVRNAPIMQRKWVKIVPHVNDTILLGSAIIMLFMIGQYPFIDSWLTAKVIALFVYIGLGMAALKFCRNRYCRLLTFAGALLTFFYIVSVARVRDPAGFLLFF